MGDKFKSFLFKNTTPKQTVAKNTFWLSVSNFGGRLIKAAVIIYAARALGASEWGIFSYATTLAAFFTLFVDPGLNAIVMRDAGKMPEEKRRALFSTAFILKLVLIGLSTVFIIFIAPFFSTLPGAKTLLPIAALIIVFDALRECFSALIRSMEKMEWEAGIYLLTNLAIVVAGFAFLFAIPNAMSFGWGYVIGTSVGTIAAAIVIAPYLKKTVAYFSKNLVSTIMRSAWPFAATSALGFLLTSADILIISWFLTATDVGVYSAGVRIVQLFYLIPMIVQYSTLPLFSRLAARDDHSFQIAFENIVGVIFMASIPLALGGVILGTQVMTFVFGSAYAAGGLAFKVLMLTMLVDFPAMVIGGAIFAYNQQKSLVTSSIIAGTTNVALDLIFIPMFGIVGSSIATLIAQTASNWYLWRSMKKLSQFSILPRLKNLIIAGAIMAVAAILFITLHIPFLVNVTVSAIVYFFVLYIFREPLLVEIKNILRGVNAAKVTV